MPTASSDILEAQKKEILTSSRCVCVVQLFVVFFEI